METLKPTELYLTPKEAAVILKVNRRTVHEWLRNGKLKGVKFGERAWRVHREEVERVLN